MKTFSRLSLYVFLGIVLMLVGGAASAQEPFLVVVGAEGFTDNAVEGDAVRVQFRAGFDGVAKSGISLSITAVNVNVTSHTVPGDHDTGLGGILTVQGTLAKANANASISAKWKVSEKRTLDATGGIDAGDDDISPVVIVVKSPMPDPDSPNLFTQKITIENRDTRYNSLPLSAWQMDVVYNTLILKVDNVTPGDFLSEGGTVEVHNHDKSTPGKVSFSQARAGLTAGVASPATPPGIVLEPGDIGTLLTIKFEVLAVDEGLLGITNVRLQSDTDYNEDGSDDRISYSVLVTDVFVTTHKSSAPEDVNQDLKVNVQDLVMVAGSIGQVPHNPRADVNGDGSVNVLDLVQIYTSTDWAGSVEPIMVNGKNEPALMAPSVKRNVGPATIQAWINLARVEDDGSAIFDLGIANLEALLASRIPSETKLLLNYPNPFNPETWIPYQLAKATDVTVTIHSMNGSLIRTLELGHQAAGTYKSKSQSAYWDGRNEFGEQVASGLYFYTLTAGDFSATGRMLVRK